MNFEGFVEYLKNNKEINYNLLNEKNFRYVNYFLYRIKTAFDSYSNESDDANKIWFNDKLNTLTEKHKNITNHAGILGELQIYGLLNNSPFKQGLKCVKTNQNATPDFIYETTVDGKKIKINIEVASSLGTGDEKKRKTEQGEIFTYGKPEREGIDNSLSELIRMMNRIKKGDIQMKEDDINILAINLVNPIGEPIFLNL